MPRAIRKQHLSEEEIEMIATKGVKHGDLDGLLADDIRMIAARAGLGKARMWSKLEMVKRLKTRGIE